MQNYKKKLLLKMVIKITIVGIVLTEFIDQIKKYNIIFVIFIYLTFSKLSSNIIIFYIYSL